MFDDFDHEEIPDHLRKEPTRIVCYHGVAALGVTIPAIEENRVAIRIFGHLVRDHESSEELPPPDSERIEFILDEKECLELINAIKTGYEGTYGQPPFIMIYGGVFG